MAGRIEFGSNGATIRCWPRAGKKDANGWRFIPDHERGVLESDEGTKFEVLPREDRDGGGGGEPNGSAPTETPPVGGELVPIERALEQGPARQRLQSVSKFPLTASDAHREVRKEEQATFELILRRQRVAWIIADWGLGKEGFVAAALERFGRSAADQDVYRLQCDELENVSGIFSAAEAQFGLSFQKFCAFAAALPALVLIFDDVPIEFSRGSEAEIFSRLIKTTLDYCPSLLVIVTARQVDDSVIGGAIHLKALDVIDVKKFLHAARPTAPAFDDPDMIERIHVWSGGLPTHLERLVEMIEISTLADILAEGEYYAPSSTRAEPVPKQLQHAVSALAKSGNLYSRRSFRLLKVLTVLSEGETIQSIKRFYPSEPFYLQNATELMRLSLLESGSSSVSVGDLTPTSSSTRSERDLPKILRVPRQVRDYVRDLIPEKERSEIVLAATELLFGRRWREGKIQLRADRPSFTKGNESGGIGNEKTVICHLLSDAIKKRNAAIVKRIARLGLHYGQKLLQNDRFRDATLIGEDLVRLLESTDCIEEWVEAGEIYGRGLRMTGHRAEAIKVLQTALEKGKSFLPQEAQATFYIGIALAYDAERNKEAAVAAAREVLELIPETSAQAFQAKGIIIEATEEGYQQQKQLSDLEQASRKKKYYTVANNIALTLAQMTDNVDESLRLQQRVLREAEDTYNRVRAIIDKARLLQQANRLPDLSSNDRRMLSSAYSYSYGQRMGLLFDKCHKVLWGVLSKDNLWVQLVRLFRHSSFLWRLKGSDKEETTYLHELDPLDLRQLGASEGPSLEVEIHYLERRREEVGTASQDKSPSD
jgi:tetratricopeptide (TPR) repeat protein